jgi:hypothetical protein
VYQVHWYDHLARRVPLDTPVAAFGLDRPLWLGEFPTNGASQSVGQILTAAATAGYDAALSWSALGTDDASNGRAAVVAAGDWLSTRRD